MINGIVCHLHMTPASATHAAGASPFAKKIKDAFTLLQLQLCGGYDIGTGEGEVMIRT